MAKLVLTLDNTILGEYPIVKARTMIGRRSVSDIHLDHLAVSGEHAVILQIGHDYYLEDINSTNGTRINGTLIKKHLMQHNEVVEIGRYKLRFLSEQASTHESQYPTSSVIDELASKPQGLVEDGLANAQENNVPPLPKVGEITDSQGIDTLLAKVKVLNGSNSGRELTINKALTTLGKVGSQVAVITKRPHGYFISHIEGKVFPLLNGASIGSQSVALHSKDVIELAGVKMEFSLSSAE